MRKTLLSTIAVCFMGSTLFAQQLKVPAPSPTQTIDQAFALSNIKVEYSRPSAKGRDVFGDLVPFGKRWRTGANGSTKMTFGDDVMIEGKTLPAGTYAIYTVPGRDRWEIVFNKNLKLGGDVAEYKESDDVLRISVKPVQLPYNVETFTINFANLTANTARVDLLWQETRASFNVKAEIDEKIMSSISKALEVDSRPYFSAASYYYDNGKDLNQALTWVDKAIDQNPKAFWVQHLKAKIQLKKGDRKDAIATAEKSMELARDAQNDDYVKLNQKLIAKARGK